MMWWRISGCVLASVCWLSACEKSDKTATPPATSAPVPLLVPTVSAHPTTEQLVDGPRKRLDLRYVPLSVTAPDSWSVQARKLGDEVSQYTLEGPTIADDIRFRIPLSRQIKPEQEALLEKDAKETLAAHPELLGTSVVRDFTGGKVIERLELKTLLPTTEEIKDLPRGPTRPMTSVLWTFTVCVPEGAGFTVYDLTVSLPLNQYKADHAFVRTIMNTLTLK